MFCSEGCFFFFQVHLETTGEAAGINKEKKTETNLAGSCCEPFQCDGLFSGEFVILCYKKLCHQLFFFNKETVLFFCFFLICHNSENSKLL